MTKKKSEKLKKLKKLRVYKRKEFEKFLELLRGNTSYHWVQIASALGVTPQSITAWKKLPMAQKAIRDGIDKAMEGMEKAGKNDWRMWESKLKMLGVTPIEKRDLTSDGEKLEGLVIVKHESKSK